MGDFIEDKAVVRVDAVINLNLKEQILPC